MKQRVNYILLIIFIYSFLIYPGFAQGAEVRATVDRTSVTLGDSIQLSVSISGGDGNVDVSPIQDFRVIQRGTRSESEFQFGINRSVSRRETVYNYALVPFKEGRLRIPPLTVVSDGQMLKTDEIFIEVTKTTQRQPDTANRDVFVEGSVSNLAPYEGEQFLYTFKFYNAVPIGNNARLQKPDFSGFTAKDIEGSKRSYRQMIYGREYNVTELTYVLVPLNAGEKIIEPASLECDVVRRKSSSRNLPFFDDPFFGHTELEPKILRTEPLTINVKPLPQYTGDGKFSGLVGKFTIRAEIDNKELKVGDSTTVSIIIDGSGNIIDAGEPEMKIPDAFKSYKDSPQEDIKIGNNSGYTGKKIFRIALVPMKEGTYTIEPIKFSYFDISKGEYVTQYTQPISLMIKPSLEKDKMEVVSAAPPTVTSFKKKVEFTGRDILPLKEELDALENRTSLPSIRFILFLAIPAVLFIMIRTALIYTRKTHDPSVLMAQRAEKSLKEALNASKEEVIFSCLYRAVISAILSKAGLMGESLTYTEAEQILRSNGYSDEFASGAAKVLEKIESAKFSGLSTDSEFKNTIFSETQQLIRELSR